MIFLNLFTCVLSGLSLGALRMGCGLVTLDIRRIALGMDAWILFKRE
jgi:hypothetical protein